MPEIRLDLDRREAPVGGRLAGVVTLRVETPLSVRGVTVELAGLERQTPHRQVVLTGREPLRGRAERFVDNWRCILGRQRYPSILAGEYSYPFVLEVPEDASPSEPGLVYTLTARLDVPGIFGRGASAMEEVRLVESGEQG